MTFYHSLRWTHSFFVRSSLAFKSLLLSLLLCSGILSHAQQDETYEGDSMDPVTITEDEAREILKGLLDVKRFTHSMGVSKIARDPELVAFAEGFVERNSIEVLTIGYIDSEEFWPKVFRNVRINKIEKAETDKLIAAHLMFIPIKDEEGKITSYTVELKLEGKSTEVYDLLKITQEEVELIAEETNTNQLGDTPYDKPTDAQQVAVQALIAALQRVEQNTDPVAQSVELVTFEKITTPNNNTYGFDPPLREELKNDYPLITVGGETTRTAWKSLQSGTTDQVIALDPAAQDLTFEHDGIPVNATAGQDNAYTLNLNGSSDGVTGEVLAKVGDVVAGKLNTISYNNTDATIKVVPVNGAGANITTADLQNTLNAIYKPAIASWNVEVLANQTLTGWDDSDGLDDGETGMLSNYTGEMNALIKSFKDQNDRDGNAYYIFLVHRAENSAKKGYMPRKKQWGFVFTGSHSNKADIMTTIAHELGHGVYRLEHTFSEKGLPQNDTENLMDYGGGRELYKYQWDYVHDPASTVTLFDDEEEGAMEEMSEEEFDLFYSSVETSMNSSSSELRKTVEKIKAIYEFLEQCNNENWTSYQGQGIVPHCLWKDSEGKSIPFTAGVVDGAYLEYEGITQLGPIVNQLHDNVSQLIYSYTLGYWKCNLDNIEANAIEYQRVLNRLKTLESDPGLWSWVQQQWLEDDREDLDEYWEECNAVFDTRQGVDDLYEFVTDWREMLDLYFEVEAKITEYLVTLQSESNQGYYERGRLVIPAATILFDGVGALSKMPKAKKALQGMKRAIDEGEWTKFTGKLDDLHSSGGLARYSNVRKYLGDARTKQYLSNRQLLDFENTIKGAHPNVLKHMDEMNEYDFAEMVRGYKDNPTGFNEVVKDYDLFNGTNGWLSFWTLTPKMENSLSTISQLKAGNKLQDIGNATDIQLASIHAYTANGNFINVPYRYSSSWFGKYNTKAVQHINEGLDELRKIPERIFRGDVFSGKTFSRADFERKFVGKMNTDHPYEGYMSTSKQESVAEGFIELTAQWAGDGEKVAVIHKVTPRNGVYVDDLSDWGKNLGNVRHPNANPKVKVQEEVLLNSGKIRQVSEPIPIMENGGHKTINGLKAYYVNFVEVL